MQTPAGRRPNLSPRSEEARIGGFLGAIQQPVAAPQNATASPAASLSTQREGTTKKVVTKGGDRTRGASWLKCKVCGKVLESETAATLHEQRCVAESRDPQRVSEALAGSKQAGNQFSAHGTLLGQRTKVTVPLQGPGTAPVTAKPESAPAPAPESEAQVQITLPSIQAGHMSPTNPFAMWVESLPSIDEDKLRAPAVTEIEPSRPSAQMPQQREEDPRRQLKTAEVDALSRHSWCTASRAHRPQMQSQAQLEMLRQQQEMSRLLHQQLSISQSLQSSTVQRSELPSPAKGHTSLLLQSNDTFNDTFESPSQLQDVSFSRRQSPEQNPQFGGQPGFVGLEITKTVPHEVISVMVVDEANLTQDEEGYSNYKILPGDRLLAVNGQQCERVDVQEIHALLKGPAGTAVELSLARRQMPAQEESAPLVCRSENAVYRVRVMRHAALRQEILSRKKGQHSSSVFSAIPQTVVAETSPIVVKTNMHSTKFPVSNQASAKAQEALPPAGASRLETHTMETLMEPLLTMQTAAAGVITAAAVTLEDQVATASSVVSVAADRAASATGANAWVASTVGPISASVASGHGSESRALDTSPEVFEASSLADDRKDSIDGARSGTRSSADGLKSESRASSRPMSQGRSTAARASVDDAPAPEIGAVAVAEDEVGPATACTVKHSESGPGNTAQSLGQDSGSRAADTSPDVFETAFESFTDCNGITGGAGPGKGSGADSARAKSQTSSRPVSQGRSAASPVAAGDHVSDWAHHDEGEIHVALGADRINGDADDNQQQLPAGAQDAAGNSEGLPDFKVHETMTDFLGGVVGSLAFFDASVKNSTSQPSSVEGHASNQAMSTRCRSPRTRSTASGDPACNKDSSRAEMPEAMQMLLGQGLYVSYMQIGESASARHQMQVLLCLTFA